MIYYFVVPTLDAMLDYKLVDLWPKYQCLNDVHSPDFQNQIKRDAALMAIAHNLGQTGKKISNCLCSCREATVLVCNHMESGSSMEMLESGSSMEKISS